MKYMENMTGRMTFQLPQTYTASRENKIELVMLVSDFMVNSRLKILNGNSMEFMECLNKMQKEKRTLSVHQE